MNRYRRSNALSQQLSAQHTEVSLAQSGAGPSMYFIDDNEPKRPNIISRGKARLSSSTTQLTPNPVGITHNSSGSSASAVLASQNQQTLLANLQAAQEQLLESPATIPSTSESLDIAAGNSTSLQNAINEIFTTSAVNNTSAVSISSNEQMSIDAIPFHLLNDDNTQTLLNSGQFETIETEDGNVLLILKEDIENSSAGQPTNPVTFNTELLPVSTNPTYPLIDNDVTTCTSSIESPISSVGINTSVVQQQQELIEQQTQQLLEQQTSLIQLAQQQQQLETINLSDQIILNAGDNNGNQPQQYFLVQMPDGTSFLVSADGVDADGNPILPDIGQVEPTTAPVPEAPIIPIPPPIPITKPTPKSKPKSVKPRAKPPQTKPVNSSSKYKIQIQSQPPPLVPTTRRKESTPSPEHKPSPYRFIMSEDVEEKRDAPLNPFIVKVLSESPERNVSQTLLPSTSTVSSSPPKLIPKTQPISTSTNFSPQTSQLNSVPGAEGTLVVDEDGVIELHNGLFKCSLCDKSTKLRVNMVNHINRSHKGEKPFTCADCGEAFQYPSTLRAHHQKLHVIKVYKCVPCMIEFKSEVELKTHFTTIHGSGKNFVVVSSSSTLPTTTLSGSATASQTGNKPDAKTNMICEHCKKQYTCKNNFMRHKVEHWEPTTGNISCDECNQDFCSKELYLTHVVHIHKEDKLLQYVCEVCKKSFKTEEYLKSHSTIHGKAPEVLPFKQTILPESPQNSLIGFVQHSTLLNNSTRPPTGSPKHQVYLCSRCDVIFTSSDALKSHFDLVHPQLIGSQILLKTKKVPATYLEKKLSEQLKASNATLVPTGSTATKTVTSPGKLANKIETAALSGIVNIAPASSASASTTATVTSRESLVTSSGSITPDTVPIGIGNMARKIETASSFQSVSVVNQPKIPTIQLIEPNKPDEKVMLQPSKSEIANDSITVNNNNKPAGKEVSPKKNELLISQNTTTVPKEPIKQQVAKPKLQKFNLESVVTSIGKDVAFLSQSIDKTREEDELKANEGVVKSKDTQDPKPSIVEQSKKKTISKSKNKVISEEKQNNLGEIAPEAATNNKKAKKQSDGIGTKTQQVVVVKPKIKTENKTKDKKQSKTLSSPVQTATRVSQRQNKGQTSKNEDFVDLKSKTSDSEKSPASKSQNVVETPSPSPKKRGRKRKTSVSEEAPTPPPPPKVAKTKKSDSPPQKPNSKSSTTNKTQTKPIVNGKRETPTRITRGTKAGKK